MSAQSSIGVGMKGASKAMAAMNKVGQYLINCFQHLIFLQLTSIYDTLTGIQLLSAGMRLSIRLPKFMNLRRQEKRQNAHLLLIS